MPDEPDRFRNRDNEISPDAGRFRNRDNEISPDAGRFRNRDNEIETRGGFNEARPVGRDDRFYDSGEGVRSRAIVNQPDVVLFSEDSPSDSTRFVPVLLCQNGEYKAAGLLGQVNE